MSLYQLAPSLQPLRGLAYLWQIFLRYNNYDALCYDVLLEHL